MKRREFLKLGSAASVVAVFPKIAVDAARDKSIPHDEPVIDYIEPYGYTVEFGQEVSGRQQ